MTPRHFALIPAAGSGTRTGIGVPKQYLPVAGVPMLARTIAAFAAVRAIARVVVVVAPDDPHVDEILAATDVVIVRDGGATRDASVANGLAALAALAADEDWVLVHDAARCGVTAEVVERLIAEVADHEVGGLLALPLDDTVKRETDPASPTRTVAGTVDRRGLWRAQTPQMFRYRVLRDALGAARRRGIAVTDEASAIEAAGLHPLLVAGSPRNFKVTTADDLAMMDVLLRRALETVDA